MFSSAINRSSWVPFKTILRVLLYRQMTLSGEGKLQTGRDFDHLVIVNTNSGMFSLASLVNVALLLVWRPANLLLCSNSYPSQQHYPPDMVPGFNFCFGPAHSCLSLEPEIFISTLFLTARCLHHMVLFVSARVIT